NILLPCFVFSKVVGNPMVKNSTNAFWAPLAGFCGVAIPMLLCFLVARYVIKIKAFEDKPTRRTFAVATGLQNYGYIAIPVIDKVFGDDLLGIMLLHNMGVDLAIWSIGIMLLNGSVDKSSLKKMINGPSITVIVSLLINAVGFDAYVPTMIKSSVDTIGAGFIPIGIMLVGTTIYGCLRSPDVVGRMSVKICLY
ncbi:MAG: hypothetical protein NE330_22755, partial [Lentisphaeraceae bacterium]|nr:hypothetical protein [Lentisphaeraceae bacterium]